MQITHYPTDALFEAALEPLLQRLPDTNPRLLMRYEIPDATRCAVIEDSEPQLFLRSGPKDRWWIAGERADLVAPLLSALHPLPNLFGQTEVVSAAIDFYRAQQKEPKRVFTVNWYRLGTLNKPAPTSGFMRLATSEDEAAVVPLMDALYREAMHINPAPEVVKADFDRHFAANSIHLWTHESKLVAMAMAFENGRKLRRIGGVYTLPEFRGHGYCKAITAALCEKIIAQGGEVALHADAAHPFTNQMYQSLGFVQKSQHIDCTF